MSLTLIAAPLLRPLTLEAAKVHLRVETDDDDTMIDELLDAAINHFDGPEGWLRRALVQQTWELRLHCFPPCIELPLPPLIQVDAVRYVDLNGDLQTLTETTDYQVATGGKMKRAIIAPAFNKNWPAIRHEPDAVRVTFTCGYAEVSEESPIAFITLVPPALVTSLKFQLEIFYGRNPQAVPTLQKAIEDLANRYRVYE